MIDFSTDVRSFRDGFLPATPDNLRDAEKYLDDLEATGSTNISGALAEALSQMGAAITAVIDDYDFILLDCPPSLSLLTLNGLCAADSVLIPMQCEYYALEGLSDLVQTIRKVRAHLNPRLEVKGAVLTMFDSRTRLSSQVGDEVRRHLGERVYETVIPRAVRLSEAPSHGQTVMTYDPGSRGAVGYLQAARELAERGAGATRDQKQKESDA